MNRIRFALAITLFASVAVTCARLAAQEPTQEPNKHEVPPPPRQPEVSPPRRQQEAKPPKTERQEEPQPSKERKKEEKKEQKKAAHEQHGTSAEHGKARPAGKGAHIPDPQFKAHFGNQHKFVVNRVLTTTTVVPNQTQFVYVGYTFIFVDPWPSDWLFTDDCYIDYVDDEYFLFDVFHPGVRVALFVVG